MDIDELDPEFHVPSVEGEPNREGLTELQEFNQWIDRHTALLAIAPIYCIFR